MSDVTKIRLPDNSELNIKDYRIPGVDMTPTSGSDNVVTSGGVYQAINDDELVISAAINDLNNRIETIEDDYVVAEAFDEIEDVVRGTYTKQEVDNLFNTYDPQITETDPVFVASPAHGITTSDITNWNSKTSNTGTLTGVSFNGTNATISNGVASITASIPTKVSDLTNDSGFTSNAGTITGITMNGASKGTSGVVDLGTVLTSETSLSKGTTTGSGNAVTDISVSGHQITLTKGSTFLTSETSLSKGTTTGSGNAVTDISVSGHQIILTKGTTFLTSHQDISGKANLSGAAFTGTVTGTSSGNTAQFRNVTISSLEPTSSDGNNGDIWIVI